MVGEGTVTEEVIKCLECGSTEFLLVPGPDGVKVWHCIPCGMDYNRGLDSNGNLVRWQGRPVLFEYVACKRCWEHFYTWGDLYEHEKICSVEEEGDD